MASTKNIADVLSIYPVKESFVNATTYNDLISLNLTSKDVYCALHSATFDKERARKDDDAHFGMLTHRVAPDHLVCEVTPDPSLGLEMRKCSIHVRRCIKCRRGACNLGKTDLEERHGHRDTELLRLRPACLQCLKNGYNPVLSETCYIGGCTPNLPDRLTHRQDLKKDFVAERCQCLTNSSSERRWLCWECKTAEFEADAAFTVFVRQTGGDLCECGGKVFKGILRKGATEEELPEQADMNMFIDISTEQDSASNSGPGEGQSGYTPPNDQEGYEPFSEDESNDISDNHLPNPGFTVPIRQFNKDGFWHDITSQPTRSVIGLCAWCGLRVHGTHPSEARLGRMAHSRARRNYEDLEQIIIHDSDVSDDGWESDEEHPNWMTFKFPWMSVNSPSSTDLQQNDVCYREIDNYDDQNDNQETDHDNYHDNDQDDGQDDDQDDDHDSDDDGGIPNA